AVTVMHPAFAPSKDGPIDLGPGEQLEGKVLQLAAGLSASGKVSDAQSGEPVAGARVSLTARGRRGEPREGRAGADGAFQVNGLEEGDYDLRAAAPGYLRTKPRTVAVLASGTAVTPVLLERGGSISGRVLDPDGKPVAGAL